MNSHNLISSIFPLLSLDFFLLFSLIVFCNLCLFNLCSFIQVNLQFFWKHLILSKIFDLLKIKVLISTSIFFWHLFLFINALRHVFLVGSYFIFLAVQRLREVYTCTMYIVQQGGPKCQEVVRSLWPLDIFCLYICMITGIL